MHGAQLEFRSGLSDSDETKISGVNTMHWKSFVAYLIIQYSDRGMGGGSNVWNGELLFEFSTAFMFLVFHQMYIFIAIAYWYGSSKPAVLSLGTQVLQDRAKS